MKMTRGKQQILFNYLPGKTFDFDKSNRLAQITSIRGIQKTDLNVDLVLQAIERYAFAWQENLAGVFHRPQVDQFVLLQPTRVYSQTYPKVLWLPVVWSCVRLQREISTPKYHMSGLSKGKDDSTSLDSGTSLWSH